jgi:mono/diheme cytochrome c family protein
MKFAALALCIGLLSCATLAPRDNDSIERGKYLVDLLGCAGCHTDGQLFNRPRQNRYLAGSTTGIGYTNDSNPGVVFPANLTPDRKTGIGRWTLEDIKRAIRFGMDKHGRQQLPIMPWPRYQQMSDEDAGAIASYLLSLPPTENKVPEEVTPNALSTAPYVRFGVYLFVPDTEDTNEEPRSDDARSTRS